MSNKIYLKSLFDFDLPFNYEDCFKININNLFLEFYNEGTKYYLPSNIFLNNIYRLTNNELVINNIKYFKTSILAVEIHSYKNPIYLNNDLDIISYFVLIVNIIPIIMLNLNNNFKNIKYRILIDNNKKDSLILSIINKILPILNDKIIIYTKYFLMIKSFIEINNITDIEIDNIYQDLLEIIIILISINITLGQNFEINKINIDNIFLEKDLLDLDKINNYKILKIIDELFESYQIKKIYTYKD